MAEVLLLHRLVMEQGRQQPFLYASLAAKAAALGFSLIQNHPFVDGNKRVGHAAMVAFLRLNGRQLDASVDEAERTILQVASGALDRAGLQAWVAAHESPA